LHKITILLYVVEKIFFLTTLFSLVPDAYEDEERGVGLVVTGPFYPSRMNDESSDWLSYYASIFHYVEIDDDKTAKANQDL
jgi:hypothetical protein